MKDMTASCHICNAKTIVLFDVPFEFEGQRHDFYIAKCTGCGLGTTEPQPTDALLARIYSGEYWARESTVAKQGTMAKLVHWFNEVRLQAVISPLLKRLPVGAAVLEVGAGSGQLAAYLKRQGLEVEITDYSSDMVQEIERMHGIRGHVGALEDLHLQQGHYDAVVFNNVLEHLRDPVGALKIAEGLLKPGGLVFVEVPSIGGLQFRLFGKRWFNLMIPEHIHHFTPRALGIAAQGAGLEVVWQSQFSARTSTVGYAASLFPSLRPERLRQGWPAGKIALFLCLQVAFLPLAVLEAWAGRGAVIRSLLAKR